MSEETNLPDLAPGVGAAVRAAEIAPTAEDLARDPRADLERVLAGDWGPTARKAADALAAFAALAMPAALRRAVAAETQLAAVLGLDAPDVAALMDRWDRTEPHVQRAIVAKLAGEVNKARDALQGAVNMAEDAGRIAARRVGADPEVRDLLLHEFGTTEPDLLRDCIAGLRGGCNEQAERAGRQRQAFREVLVLVRSGMGGPALAQAIERAAAAFEEGT